MYVFTREDVQGNEDEKVVTLTAQYGKIIVRYENDNVIFLNNLDLRKEDTGASHISLLKLTSASPWVINTN